jgi:hypothetical protein
VKNRGTPRCGRAILRLFVASRLVAGVVIGLNDSAYAQISGGQLVNLDAERASFTAVHRYSPADRLGHEQIALPHNISVASEYRSTLESMLVGSATFRRQCQRLANESSLRVYLRYVPAQLAGGARAISHISRTSRGLLVHVTVHPFHNDVEMIAHEFEHIIEQLDDIDLEQKARRADSGVRATYHAGPVFETERALRVGLRVVEEIRQNARQKG